MKRLKKLPHHMKKILRVASSKAHFLNYRIYLIGGIVRDIILKKPNYDLDIVVEGDGIRFAKVLAEQFNTDFRKHHSFGTATVYYGDFKIDIATSRSESYAHWGALPGVEPALLKYDLFRRDFTINAMAVSLNKEDYGALLDFYGGYNDLKKKAIRVLHDNSFLDDPTRIFRAIRFEQRFSFRITPHTLKLLKESIKVDALSLVNAHRIRDELILILGEEDPYSYVKRINELMGLSFIDPRLTLRREDFLLLRRIGNALQWYRKTFTHYRRPEKWFVYLLAIVHILPHKRLVNFSSRFGFRKKERNILCSLLEDKERIKRLRMPSLCTTDIYKICKSFSFEEIVFFYALFNEYYARKRISIFLEKLPYAKLIVRGKDLKEMGVKPENAYGRILQELLSRKIERSITTKRRELRELKVILKQEKYI